MEDANISKVLWKPGTCLWPVPPVMVSCGEVPEEFNIITIAWTGIVNSDPPMTYISVRPARHSYQIIKNSGAFVINLTTEELLKATDWCGVKSGRNHNKFQEMRLTPLQASQVSAPLIKESPLNMECVVKDIIPLGTHHMFLAEIVAVHASTEYIDPETSSFLPYKAGLLAYLHGTYSKLEKPIGTFGFSVMKQSTLRKKTAKGMPPLGFSKEE